MTSAEKSWQFGGGPGTLGYRVFDAVRRRLNRGLVSYLTRRVPLAAGSRVLEAGSGPGSASSLLARGHKVFAVALDIDSSALHEARRRDPSLHVVVGDLYALPFRDGAFDLVWNSSTLEHLAEPGRALEEMHRVVRPAGYVFVGVPYRWGPLGFQPWVRWTALGEWLGPVFTRSQLVAEMRGAQLEPLDVMFYFFRFFIGVLARA